MSQFCLNLTKSNVLNVLQSRSFVFLVKSGIALGTVYYASEQGIWRDSNETTKLYGKICTAIDPYWQQVKTQLPFKIPDLPKSNQISYMLGQSWNKGVTTTFIFLGNLPDHICEWTSKGVNTVMNNEEIKKLLSSASSEVKDSNKK